MRHTLHAEWTKLRTLPGTIWLLAAMAGLTIAVSAAAAAATRCPSGPACPIDTGKLSHDRWAGNPGHHQPAQPAHQPVGRPRRPRRLRDA